jgi:hypothetical protein
LANTLLLGALDDRVPHQVDFGLCAPATLEEHVLMALALGLSAKGIKLVGKPGFPTKTGQ